MPTAALSIGGSLLGALGNRGGGQQTTDTNRTSSGNRSSQNFTQGTEDPILAGFRELFLGGLAGGLKTAQQPVFGEAQQAGFLEQLNDITNNSFQQIKQKFGASGGLGSGAEEQLTRDVAFNKAGQQVDFFRDLPFQEQQAQLSQILPFLQTGLGFVGSGPTGQFSSGSEQFTGTENSRSTTQLPQQSLFSSLLGGLGGGLGQITNQRNFNNTLSQFGFGGGVRPTNTQRPGVNSFPNISRQNVDPFNPFR